MHTEGVEDDFEKTFAQIVIPSSQLPIYEKQGWTLAGTHESMKVGNGHEVAITVYIRKRICNF